MSKKIFKCATCGKSDNVKVVKLEDGCHNDCCDYECFCNNDNCYDDIFGFSENNAIENWNNKQLVKYLMKEIDKFSKFNFCTSCGVRNEHEVVLKTNKDGYDVLVCVECGYPVSNISFMDIKNFLDYNNLKEYFE